MDVGTSGKDNRSHVNLSAIATEVGQPLCKATRLSHLYLVWLHCILLMHREKMGSWRLQRKIILSSMPSLHVPRKKWMKPHAKPSINTLPNSMEQRSQFLSTNTDMMCSWNHMVQRKGRTLLRNSRGLMLVASLHVKMSSTKKSTVAISLQQLGKQHPTT